MVWKDQRNEINEWISEVYNNLYNSRWEYKRKISSLMNYSDGYHARGRNYNFFFIPHFFLSIISFILSWHSRECQRKLPIPSTDSLYYARIHIFIFYIKSNAPLLFDFFFFLFFSKKKNCSYKKSIFFPCVKSRNIQLY